MRSKKDLEDRSKRHLTPRLSEAETEAAHRRFAVGWQSLNTRTTAWWERRHPYIRIYTGMFWRVLIALLVLLPVMGIIDCYVEMYILDKIVGTSVSHTVLGWEVPCLCIMN